MPVSTCASSRILPALLLILLAPVSSAAGFHDFSFRRLDSTASESLAQFRGRPLLLTFFEPQCNWCLRQSRAIDALREDCPAVQAAALGINGSRPDLQRSYRRNGSGFPGFESSPRLTAAIGDISGTPFTLVVDADGGVLGWFQGYQPLESLRQSLATLLPEACPTSR